MDTFPFSRLFQSTLSLCGIALRTFSRTTSVFVFLSLFILQACGGGGDSTPPVVETPDDHKTISGTAAAGSPVVGIVSVKGANGETASAPIELDGSYSINVDALTEPYILFASGSVNDKSVEYYSSGVTGVINITHLTDYIIRNATQVQLNDVYTNWASSQISAAALTTASTEVVQQISPLLGSAGIDTATVNLITTPFNTDLSGLDLVLEAIDVSYSGNTATVSNNLTGSQFTNDLSTPTDNGTGLPASDTSAMVTVLTDQSAINALFDQLEVLYATTIPDQTQIDTFAPSISDDYLETGITKTQELDRFLAGEGGPEVGIDINAIIDSPMDVSATAFQKGYRVQLHVTWPGFTGRILTSVVYDGSNWLWYGNRQWIKTDMSWTAIMNTTDDGSVTYQTGLSIGGDALEDETHYAYDNGVRSGIITGPGLPASGLVVQHNYPSIDFSFFADGENEYWITDDNVISAIPDNSLYTINLYSQTADAVTLADTPLTSLTQTLMKRPYTNAALSSDLFPVFISPVSHSVADLNIPGTLNVTWQNASSIDTIFIVLGWSDSSFAWNQLDSIVEPGMTSHTFDTTGFLAPGPLGILGLVSSDQYMRLLIHRWDYVNPANIATPTSSTAG